MTRALSTVVIGGTCVDHVLEFDALTLGRKNPIRGSSRFVGGGAANNAIGMRKLAPDAKITLVAPLGDDEEGRAVQKKMEDFGIDLPWAPISDASTSSSFILNDSGRSTPCVHSGARNTPIPEVLLKQAIANADVCSLVGPGRNDQIPVILRIAARHGHPVFFALGSTQINELRMFELSEFLIDPVEMLTCNRLEAHRLTGTNVIREQFGELRFGGRVRIVIITDGPNGVHACRAGKTFHVNAFRDDRSLVDDVGAGDATHAGIVHGVTLGLPLELALTAGVRNGWECCTALGATTCLLAAADWENYLSVIGGTFA